MASCLECEHSCVKDKSIQFCNKLADEQFEHLVEQFDRKMKRKSNWHFSLEEHVAGYCTEYAPVKVGHCDMCSLPINVSRETWRLKLYNPVSGNFATACSPRCLLKISRLIRWYKKTYHKQNQ